MWLICSALCLPFLLHKAWLAQVVDAVSYQHLSYVVHSAGLCLHHLLCFAVVYHMYLSFQEDLQNSDFMCLQSKHICTEIGCNDLGIIRLTSNTAYCLLRECKVLLKISLDKVVLIRLHHNSFQGDSQTHMLIVRITHLLVWPIDLADLPK